MRRLAQLFNELDSTNSTNAKVEALAQYFNEAEDQDKVWTIALLAHRRPPRAVNYRLMSDWAAEEAGIPTWLFEESYHIVGDYAETIALLIPDRADSSEEDSPALTYYMELMIHLKGKDEAYIKERIVEAWRTLPDTGRFLFNKLITGGLRVGVSQKLMVKALSKSTGIDENILSLRLMGDWDPAMVSFDELVIADNPEENLSRPYPFYLAYALDIEPAELGNPDEWLVERKWDGIRAQAIFREGHFYLWTRGEELVTDRYPELQDLTQQVPHGTVLDAELVAWAGKHPMPFQRLQKRIGRKRVSRKMLTEIPVHLIVYDVLEWDGVDIRSKPISKRRELLIKLLSALDFPNVHLSEEVEAPTWEALLAERSRSRELHCEGLMLKHRDSPYEVGRKRGNWWKWKVDPYTVDAVMLYAQRGHGRRASLYTDFTFAVWNEEQLVPFAKAYSGLTKEEFEEITGWVKQNTIERFGPVASVPPMHVFELHFEGIAVSTRHKSGIAVRFPRIHRWRKDKGPGDADTLESLKNLISQ